MIQGGVMERNPQIGAHGPAHRWLQLALGIICMVMVANLQYGWSLFVLPIDAKFQWGRTAIQLAFTLFILAETWLMPIAGYLADRCGTRPVVMAGGILVGMSWSLNACADSLAALYISAAIGGAGVGAVYSACIGNALKSFAGRRGLAVGLTAAGFGTVSAATVLPIHAAIQAYGYENAFLYFGLGQGLIVLLAAWGLTPSASGKIRNGKIRVSQGVRDYAPLEIVRAPAFWVMYLMFFLVAAAGLMAIAQLAPIAKEYKVANVPASLLDLTLPALMFALAIDRVFSGFARPFFGWVSDRMGREQAMCIAFGIEAAAIVALAHFGHDPLMFVLLTGLIFFAWGEIYSLFPAACADLFGVKYAATHAGMLYTAKGAAALLVLLLSGFLPPTADWRLMFFCAAAMNVVASALAVLVLRPLCTRQRIADREQPLPR
jgi:OFA family oxalate/formate antiporter-like MFS transporter